MKTYKLKIKIGENLRNLRMKLIRPRKFRPGLTLAEMLIAVGITVGLLLMTGMVFKSTTGAVGKGLAQNEIMQQIRTLTRQIDTDFTGLRTDMPFAIIFEQFEHDPDGVSGNGDEFLVRQDRIVFFANGDFQTRDYTAGNPNISANTARIFYGQAFDPYPINPDYPDIPPKQNLTRRFKLLIQNTGTWPPFITMMPSEEWDAIPVEPSTLTVWKNAPYSVYAGPPLFFGQDINASIIRRPDLAAINFVGPDGMQRNYLLPDVTDFKIQYWVYDPPPPAGRGVWRWFPDEVDFINNGVAGTTLAGVDVIMFAYAWNIPQALGTALPIDGVPWTCVAPGTLTLPSALKFTFTVYDKGRRQYPEGQTYSYIVKLPQP